MKTIKGLSGVSFEDHRYIKVEETVIGAKDKLKKQLTVTNESLYWQKKDAKQKFDWYKRIIASSVKYNKKISDSTVKAYEKAKKLWNDIENKPEEVELFAVDGDDLFIYSGLWNFLPEMDDKCHRNTEIKPYFFDCLRPEQKQGCAELLKYNRATCVMATGLGKSIMMANMAEASVKSGKRVIVVEPGDDLVGQVRDEFERFISPDISITSASNTRSIKLGSNILIVTVQSAMKYVDNYDVILTDETHHSAADTWFELFANCDRAKHWYGFTATAFRTDGLDLCIHAVGGPVVFERDLGWALENDRLCQFDAYTATVDSYDKDGRIEINENKNRQIAYGKLMKGDAPRRIAEGIIAKAVGKRRILVLTKTIVGAQMILTECKNLGICDKKQQVAKADNKYPLKLFKENTQDILFATDKLVSEGINIPNIDMIVMVTQHASLIMTMQALGRMLRKHEDKKIPILFDVMLRGYEPFEKTWFNKRLGVWEKYARNYGEISL